MNKEAMVLDYRSALEEAKKLCRSDYQHDLVCGLQALSGADLKGKAATYSSSYARSRRALLRRLKDSDIHHMEVTARHNRRVLILGRSACDAASAAASAWNGERSAATAKAERTEANKRYFDTIDEILSTQN